MAWPVCCSPLCKADSGFVERSQFLEKEQSSLLNEKDCLALLFWVLIFLFAFFYLNANMISYPFLFYTALVFPIPSALAAAEGMQFLFSFFEEMIPVPWKFSLDVWGVCMCEMPKAARERPFPISDSLAINQPL